MNNLFFKEWIAEEKSLSSFRVGIRSAIRGLWTGNLGLFGFVSAMEASISRGFRQAWIEGGGQCGIKFDELTPAELAELRRMTNEQIAFLPGFGSDIEENSRANGGLLQPLLERGGMWISQYNVVRDKASGMACGDIKKKWVIDPLKDNCSSCLRLNGKVKRNSFWISSGILPQVNGASYLECRGYNCGCRLEETNEPVSRGFLPGLRRVAVGMERTVEDIEES